MHERRVALLMNRDSSHTREVCAGVLGYVAEGARWFVHLSPSDPRALEPLKEWQPDGVIAHLFNEELADGLAAWGGPVVNITSTLNDPRFPRVEVKHDAVGVMAAEHLLERGFRHFGFAGSDRSGFAVSRKQAFHRRVQEAGGSFAACHVEDLPLRDPGTSWSGMQETFSGWLRDLPKPVGVLCSMDGVARRLAATCRSMDLNVPEEVAILGVNDDEFECVVARPNLSSIAIPARRIGYDAAALLENLMAGEPRPQSDITLQPLGVVSRRSTEAEATEDEIVRTALRYIRANYREPIRVDDVADAAGRPRRTLERRFRRALDRTVLDEITRRRIETARRLLVETDLDIGGVAKRSGFSDARRMAVVFRERLGRTPSDFRKEARPA
ncbi:MAG: DNA-binding transcriptional regulator [Planctomycetota bacterium]|nr:DNA-binding transcriptional regulator [Planctomycetota bacterium]